MIFDAYGRPVTTARLAPPKPGAQVIASPSDRYTVEAGRYLTPAKLDDIMMRANSGDVEEQSRLAAELAGKSHDIAHALRTRRNGVLGCRWSIEPGSKTIAAKMAANTISGHLGAAGSVGFDDVGRVLSFRRAIKAMLRAYLPGYSAVEILWRPGGVGFYGFRAIDNARISFETGYVPRLRVDGAESSGVPFPAGKIMFHTSEDDECDPALGGLIRPLAWLYCFAHMALKDLLSFVERHGMPFLIAKVDQSTWETERDVLNNLICNFGPRGGGVFSRAVEFELLQPSQSNGEVYFRLLSYLGDAITRVILGQTATSGDGGGLSGDNAQSKVRQDIIEADARDLEDTVNRDLIAPWAYYNGVLQSDTPRFVIHTDPPDDTATLATTIKTLFEAGFRADAQEMSERFGFRLTAVDPAAEARPETAGSGVLQASESASGEPVAADGLSAWLKPVADELTALAESDGKDFGERLAALAGHAEFGSSDAFERGLSDVMEQGREAGKKVVENRRKSRGVQRKI